MRAISTPSPIKVLIVTKDTKKDDMPKCAATKDKGNNSIVNFFCSYQIMHNE